MRAWRGLLALLLACGACVNGAGGVMVGSGPAVPEVDPRGAFHRVLAEERRVRTPGTTPATLSDYRRAVSAYVEIADRFPASPYGARALWQAAGLSLLAFDDGRDPADRGRGLAVLERLQREYPGTPAAARVDARRHRFQARDAVRWVTAIRHEPSALSTRVVVELDGPVTFDHARLDGPDRLFLDLHDTHVPPALEAGLVRFGDEVVPAARLDRRTDRVTRIVLDTSGADRCDVRATAAPFRIVTDCRARGAALSEGTPMAARAPAAPLTRQLGLGVSRVVIDPGHGGHDPGAIGHRIEEATLVLDIAERVERRLTRQAIDVVLTRRADRYLELEARSAVAGRTHADLFVSIHANASRRAEARGVETYVLDFATTAEAATVAARENRTATGTMRDLDALIRAIGGSARAAESRLLARLVQDRLVAALRTVDPAIPDLGVKEAPFAVLMGTGVPSILVEISFVSNRHDAQALARDRYRERIAGALAEAIVEYRGALKRGAAEATLTADGDRGGRPQGP